MTGRSLFSTSEIHEQQIQAIFDRARLFKRELQTKGSLDRILPQLHSSKKILAMVFSEPSTRTRLSFVTASHRLGMNSMTLDNLSVSSVSKGETFEDTIKNVMAMQPDVLVVRYGQDTSVDQLLQSSKIPVISGGVGTKEHPTQALLDAFTILENRGKLKGERVLIVGDVLHSRVANSNLSLLKKLGAEVAFCAPKEFVPSQPEWMDVPFFADIKLGLEWANVVMGLRVQKERHAPTQGIGLSLAEYREKYRIGTDQLKFLQKDAIILHPGPVIRGVEFSDAVLEDSRCRVLDQVTHGVFIRAALLSLILDLEVVE